jgi:hypothetical protein
VSHNSHSLTLYLNLYLYLTDEAHQKRRTRRRKHGAFGSETETKESNFKESDTRNSPLSLAALECRTVVRLVRCLGCVAARRCVVAVFQTQHSLSFWGACDRIRVCGWNLEWHSALVMCDVRCALRVRKRQVNVSHDGTDSQTLVEVEVSFHAPQYVLFLAQ